MKIFHISDTHGSGFWDSPLPADIDVVAHSGDAFPNSTRGNADLEKKYQSAWISNFIYPINKWLDGRPFVYVPGNHDYIEWSDFISAHRVSLNPIVVAGKVWRGFREIPRINGEWNGELYDPDMQSLIEDLFYTDSSLSFVEGDILLCHAPPSGIFDSTNKWQPCYGIPYLSNALQHRNHNFKAVLFGHVHQYAYSQTSAMGIVFSNAADTPGGVVELQ